MHSFSFFCLGGENSLTRFPRSCCFVVTRPANMGSLNDWWLHSRFELTNRGGKHQWFLWGLRKHNLGWRRGMGFHRQLPPCPLAAPDGQHGGGAGERAPMSSPASPAYQFWAGGDVQQQEAHIRGHKTHLARRNICPLLSRWENINT